jgi:hypothetical protein
MIRVADWPALKVAQALAIAGGVAAIILLIGLFSTRAQLADARGDLRSEIAGRKADLARAAADAAKQEARWAAASTDGAQRYADRIKARQPIILRSTDIVRTYAQTPAGRVNCLSPERVLGIDALDADLANAAGDPGRGDSTLHPDPAASPTGR